MSRCSGFPEAFVHAALFCCPAHTVFGSPSPGHGKEDLCTVLPAGTNKAPRTHERQWLGRNLALYAGCITICIFRGLSVGNALPESPFTAVLRGLWTGGAVPFAGTVLFV